LLQPVLSLLCAETITICLALMHVVVSFAPQTMILYNNNLSGVPVCPAIIPVVGFGDMEIIFAPFNGAV
jgi:hypothetical protein